MNATQIWLMLIGTTERARKLRARVDSLNSPPLDPAFGPEPPQCPTTVLFGAEISRLLYTDPQYRPALDAWDTGDVGKPDILRMCRYVERGTYTGPIFFPSASWRASLQTLRIVNASRAALLLQSPDRPTWESPKLTSHVQRLASRGTAGRKQRALKLTPIPWKLIEH